MSRLIDADLLGLTDMEILMCDGDYKEALIMLIDKIEHAPTVEPEPKTGKWILDWKHNKATCSECHRSFYDAFDIENYDNFCRVCGVKMESAVSRDEQA